MTDPAPFRLAILAATGTARKRTIPALAGSDVVQVSVIQGRDLSTLAPIAERFNVPRFASTIEEAIGGGDVDGVMVCSPPFMHLEQAAIVLDAGLPLLLEKPAAANLDDVTALAKLASQQSSVVRIAHHLRHQPSWLLLKDWISSEVVGRIVAADAQWNFHMNRGAASAVWKLNPELNGQSSLTDAGIHCVDAMLGLLGPGTLAGVLLNTDEGVATYENADLLLDQSGTSTHIRASRLFGPAGNDLTLYGTRGTIHAADFFTEKSSDSLVLRAEGADPVITDLGRDHGPNPYGAEVEDFARVAQGLAPEFGETTLADALAAHRLIDSALRLASDARRSTD